MYDEDVLTLDRLEVPPPEEGPDFSFLAAEGRSSWHRCLVVDDDPIIMRLVAEMLADLDYQVDTARNGLQALGAMSTCRYDLVVTDLEMPVMSGYHLASRIKNESRDTKIVIMTGHCRNELADLMSTGPVDAWLFKPFDFSELCNVLNELELPPLERRQVSSLAI